MGISRAALRGREARLFSARPPRPRTQRPSEAVGTWSVGWGLPATASSSGSVPRAPLAWLQGRGKAGARPAWRHRPSPPQSGGKEPKILPLRERQVPETPPRDLRYAVRGRGDGPSADRQKGEGGWEVMPPGDVGWTHGMALRRWHSNRRKGYRSPSWASMQGRRILRGTFKATIGHGSPISP